MNETGPLSLVIKIASILDELDIPYALGGSMASSFFGEPRATADIDVAISVDADAGERLVSRMQADFYVPEAAARAALQTQDSFNLLEVEQALKVDLFVLGRDLLDRRQIERRIRVVVPGIESAVWVTSPEDQVLRKLDWYRRGGSASERQWRDVVGLLTVGSGTIDLDYLRNTAAELGLSMVLVQALRDAEGAG